MAINRLRELRESNDLMQREVAKALGITQRNIVTLKLVILYLLKIF